MAKSNNNGVLFILVILIMAVAVIGLNQGDSVTNPNVKYYDFSDESLRGDVEIVEGDNESYTMNVLSTSTNYSIGQDALIGAFNISEYQNTSKYSYELMLNFENMGTQFNDTNSSFRFAVTTKSVNSTDDLFNSNGTVSELEGWNTFYLLQNGTYSNAINVRNASFDGVDYNALNGYVKLKITIDKTNTELKGEAWTLDTNGSEIKIYDGTPLDYSQASSLDVIEGENVYFAMVDDNNAGVINSIGTDEKLGVQLKVERLLQ